MRIVSWNVNGLRAILKNQGKCLKIFLDDLKADVICLQEIKTTRDQLDSCTYAADGYSAYFSFSRGKTGYSGVASFCRDSVAPLHAEEGITGTSLERREDGVCCYSSAEVMSSPEILTLEEEGRCVMTEHLSKECGNVVVINVYCPRVDSDNLFREEYRVKYYTAIMERCEAIERAGKCVVVVGDFNCIREQIDSAYALDDPTILETPSIRYFQEHVTSQPSCLLTGDHGPRLLDLFRYFHPTVNEAYSWWRTVTDSRKINYGKRIDFVLCSLCLCKYATAAEIWQTMLGSDHCPVYACFSLSVTPSSKLPSLCSKYFVEFAGKQQTLSSLWSSIPIKSPVKRPTDTELTVPARKPRKDSDSVQGRSILSFFKDTAEMAENKGCSKQISTTHEVENEGCCKQISTTHEVFMEEHIDYSLCVPPKPLSDEWKSVFTAPKEVLCTGHSEPCVLRVAKKQGPNFNRRFYCCARPGGRKGDPNARCNFFKWATKHSTVKR